ncbi:MAG: NAD(P)-dependent dehydrogenase (short-subunit alcohol dehydrogenase family) [Halioglobus sp.]|jgi:NAD(P)-dependent dehydrogenase (short-subunit alcohol dehydrogenase family)
MNSQTTEKSSTHSNKVVLITGCSTGIGRALAISLSKLGHTVFAGARKIESLDAIRDVRLLPLTLDVGKDSDIQAAVEEITLQAGHLDILINNAGYGAMGPLVEMPIAEIRNQFSTNVFAPIHLTQKVLPLMRKSCNAQVVNIGSSSGITPTPFSGAYCASKSALHTLTEVMRMELRPFGIHAMAVYPGGVASDFGSNASGRLSETLIENSLYADIALAIESRAKLSSDSPTSTQQFADELIATMLAPKRVAIKRIGHGSTIMPLMRYLLPIRLREYLLSRSYRLTTLSGARV